LFSVSDAVIELTTSVRKEEGGINESMKQERKPERWKEKLKGRR
jgi:hypothetical protein